MPRLDKTRAKHMIEIQSITTDSPLYEQERTLRNTILLRPLGIPDHAWEMHDEKSWHFVATDHHNVVGCVVLVPLSAHKAQFIQMAVDKSYQGKGIGRKLIQALVSFSVAEGIRELVCHAREPVVPFYTKLGFQVYGEPFVEVGIVHRYMRKIR